MQGLTEVEFEFNTQADSSHFAQVASACFIQPPLCYVGVTEEEAVEQYKGDLDVYVSKFKPLKNTLTGREERTLMKMIVHADTDDVSISILSLASINKLISASSCMR